ncbi:glycosyltransferase 87 family protein [Lapillicoccus jejuensis]|uniref:glycosyltransferase 87 family protein n=1 Tax=Lapillicoccus jejuensis TaxID=402171 RepID=UPI00114DDFBF|nr:glycosyltransferase 87 family protein [Lapillicoccus jejuensis]
MRILRVALAAAVVTAAWAVVAGLVDDGRGPRPLVLLLLLWVLVLALTGWVLRGPSPRHVLVVVGLAAAVVQLPGLAHPPLTSSDAYRYVWDGRVQLAGVSPYRYAPLDDRLAGLRDPVLFPGIGPAQRSGYLTEPVPTDRADLAARARDDARTRINRPRVPTVYPPVAEAWFAAVAAVTPWSAGTLGLQVGSALLAVGVAVALAALLRRAGRDPRHALWWAWCPLVLLETGNGAHVDVLAGALLVAAVALTGTGPGRGRRWLPGVLVGLAAGVKLVPLLVVAGLSPVLRRRWWPGLSAPLAAVGTLAATYAPHVAVAGTLVLGYLPGYLLEEDAAGRSATLRLLLPAAAVPWATAVVIAAATLLAVRGASRRPVTTASVATAGATSYGVLLLATTPTYGWYAVPLVALAVLAGRGEWFAVAVAGEVAYLGLGVPGLVTGAWCTATAVVLAAGLLRRRATHAAARRSDGSAATTSTTSATST